ncbi:MAG: hypothetical protein OXC62_05300 [Aestuariivita sp.]|nr:hypothetical protein [Aestuariivita sp.]
MNASPQKPIYSTKPAHIIIVGIMRTSAYAEPVDAKDRMNDAFRCAI